MRRCLVARAYSPHLEPPPVGVVATVLYEIPANVVKIDKSFTDKVMVDNKGEFVSQMGKFIRAAKEEIVVEGIETEEQRQFLESHGFKYGQGYLFDRPIPADEFERKYL